MKKFRNTLTEISRYPSAIFGMFIVIALLALAIYAMVKIPYQEAIRLWRGGEAVWYQNPKNVPPNWINWFTKDKLPQSFVVGVGEEGITKVITPGEKGVSEIDFSYSFEYDYDKYPQEMFLYLKTNYVDKNPFISVMMVTPDGR